jgi:CheY-like chemotaxis protein
MSALQDFFAAALLPLAIVALLGLLGVVGVVLAKRRRAAQRPLPRAQPTSAAPPPPLPALPALSIASFAPLPPRAPAPRPAPSPGATASAAPAMASAPPAPMAPAAAPSPASPVSLLVVDDSAVPRAMLRKLFEAAGYEVDLAVDGEDALERIGSKSYAVLITDLEMPKIDGFQVIAAVQNNLDTEDLPIIAITSHEELSARVHDMKGLYGIFRKPWNDRELLKRVAAVSTLRRQAAAGSGPA